MAKLRSKDVLFEYEERGGATSSSGDVYAPTLCDEEPQVPAEDPESTEANQGALYHMRHVQVHELSEGQSLGVLISGTQVMGFHHAVAISAGWQIGDQVVDVNGRLVQSFEQFEAAFNAAKNEGFPIDFAVLRRESASEVGDGLEDFFHRLEWQEIKNALYTNINPESLNSAIVAKLASQNPHRNVVQRRNTSTEPHGEDLRYPPAADMDHMAEKRIPVPLKSHRKCIKFAELIKQDLMVECSPPVQALLQRRKELRSTVDQSVESLATRLATQRIDGLASFATPRKSPRKSPRRSPRPSPRNPWIEGPDAYQHVYHASGPGRCCKVGEVPEKKISEEMSGQSCACFSL
eukprot:gnl/MRDRNA2_/MRDRNA2_56464_c0_seq1.p1 gnl/MRDRNA2_/MRDRNA2_56464_c0~~gnl/MRDRNA2_/MRDRNA2_56464_c0_seq1.p1  ORF type:complete len:349 (-),score=71.87 gnl/MRDRNA2_/MRDRNA2_56464_c0_seq1:2-1048(-)